MYKCGWNGCEKAYGTLNHLNAHVTMQSHGQKRTPEGMVDSVLRYSTFPARVVVRHYTKNREASAFVSASRHFIVLFGTCRTSCASRTTQGYACQCLVCLVSSVRDSGVGVRLPNASSRRQCNTRLWR